MEKKITPLRIISIVWKDATRYVHQLEKYENFSLVEVCSVGWLIEETEEYICIAQDIIEGDIRGVQVIPKKNITLIE